MSDPGEGLKIILSDGQDHDRAIVASAAAAAWRDVAEALTRNGEAYRQAAGEGQCAMEQRALLYAALTIRQRWPMSYRRWIRGDAPSLPSAQTFLLSRRTKRPCDWGFTEKAQFARAMLGHENSACWDVHMQRAFPHVYKDAELRRKAGTRWQWRAWLLFLYPARHPGERCTVMRQCREVLEWVRTGRMPPPKARAMRPGPLLDTDRGPDGRRCALCGERFSDPTGPQGRQGQGVVCAPCEDGLRRGDGPWF